MADWIINDQWYDNKRQNADDEAKRLVETAANYQKQTETISAIKSSGFNHMFSTNH